MAIHSFDQARLIMGADARAVYCAEFNPQGSWYDHEAAAMAIYEMTGGAVFNYRGSWCAEGLNTSWECHWRIVGEQGTVLWDGGDELRCEVVTGETGFFRKRKEIRVPMLAARQAKTGGHTGVIREFVRCVQQGGVPETTGADNIKSLAMVFGAIASAERRQRVPIKA
jgi:predicted dehydrogenase